MPSSNIGIKPTPPQKKPDCEEDCCNGSGSGGGSGDGYSGGGGGGTGGGAGSSCECDDSCSNPPAPEPAPCGCSCEPVRYGVGQVQYKEIDLSSSGFGISWGHTRSYANVLDPNNEGVNGNSWLLKQVSYLVFVNAAPGNSEPSEMVVVDSGNQSSWYDELVSTPGVYVPQFWNGSDLRHDATAKDYTWTGSKGEKRVFYDNDLSHAAELRGALKQIIDKYGNTTTATYDVNDELERIEWVGAGKSESYEYDYYDSLPHIGRLNVVTHKVNAVATGRASYEYYIDADSGGSEGDLKKVTIEEYDADAAKWKTVSNSHYRYWLQGQTNGFKHGLKYVVGPQAYANMEAAGITPSGATDAQVASFAGNYFEYENTTDRRVSKEKVRGGELTYTYAYTANPDDPAYSAVDTWDMKTVETLPSGNENRVYTNKAGSIILKIFEETSSGDEWYDYYKFTTNGWVNLHATSAAVSSVSEPVLPATTLTVTLNASSGLVYEYDYWAADNLPAGEVKDYPRNLSGLGVPYFWI